MSDGMFVYGQVWIYVIGLVNESVVSLFFMVSFDLTLASRSN